jgi:hypothetical protein
MDYALIFPSSLPVATYDSTEVCFYALFPWFRLYFCLYSRAAAASLAQQ